MRRQPLIRILPNILVIACCLISVGLSISESRLNTDGLHWGLMYANATGLNKGLIPYREIFIQYGFLTTLIQSLSLKILGDTYVSLGIITGIFYAANIYLSYCLWQKILNKWLSALSAVLMFLVHGYITYPWANYFSYTFLLIGLLFLTASSVKGNRYLLTGIFLALSFLARQSLLPILAPIYLYFFLIYISSEQNLQRVNIRNFVLFHVGFLCVIGVFILYLLKESALRDWINQSFTILAFYNSYLGSKRQILFNFLQGLFLGTTQQFSKRRDTRTLLYSLIFYNTIFMYGIILFKRFRNKVSEQEKVFFLYGSVVLFGYLQAFHSYHVFRLQSSSSLGIGLLIFSLDNLSTRFKQWKVVIFYVPIICLFIYLSNTLVLTSTSGVRTAWKQDLVKGLIKDLVLGNQLKEPKNIKVLQGKFYDDRTRYYYQTLAKTINNYSCQFEYLVNFTQNSDVPLLSESFKTIQRSPFYDEKLSEAIFPDEQDKIAQLLAKEKAILVAQNTEQIPTNYQIIRKLIVPPNVLVKKSITYVAVPSRLASRCQF